MRSIYIRIRELIQLQNVTLVSDLHVLEPLEFQGEERFIEGMMDTRNDWN